MREIVLDTETTGLSHSNGDRIIEIGCIEILDKQITQGSYHRYINPETEVSESATRISGLTYEFLKQFEPFRNVYVEFLEFVGTDRLVIHNAAFDIGFLNYELSLVGVEAIAPNRVIDTLAMTREKFPGSPATLDALCRKFSIDKTVRAKHGALVDARLLAEVYLQMSIELVQRNIFGVGDQVIQEHEADEPAQVARPHMRSFSVSKAEETAHTALVNKIKNPIWTRLAKSKAQLAQ
ncbi:MAG: DNA polymerase III subunit epsilon [Holosporales bacterium]|jgi:DNA polymerase-3 subunit epsilon|nr:DNA polymerase III subunit epsilon [Holosporales bacterium]